MRHTNGLAEGASRVETGTGGVTAGWYVARDGRRFRVYEQRCLHSCCWVAKCECGHKLTAHDFDAEGAWRCAMESLSKRDPLNRRDFAHPPDQCKATGDHA